MHTKSCTKGMVVRLSQRRKWRMLDWRLFRSWNGWFFYVQNEKNVVYGNIWQLYNPKLYMSHPIAGRYPIAVTLPIAVTFFNETHENDPVWALFPIAVSDDPIATQVCKEILSILSFLEKLLSNIMPKLFSPDVSFFHWTFFFLKSRVNSRWFCSLFCA